MTVTRQRRTPQLDTNPPIIDREIERDKRTWKHRLVRWTLFTVLAGFILLFSAVSKTTLETKEVSVGLAPQVLAKRAVKTSAENGEQARLRQATTRDQMQTAASSVDRRIPTNVPNVKEFSDEALQLMKQQHATREQTIEKFFCGPPDPNRPPGAGNPPNSLNTTRPSVAFLFMTGAKRDRNLLDDVWQEWFPPKDDDRYTIWVHHKPDKQRITVGPFFCRHAIPSVDSAYWWLHQAMMQVLKTAYDQSTATHFVFISSTTVPLQSFDRVYEQLTSTDKSCLCLHPTPYAHQVWNFSAPLLGVPREHQRKAEMWSALVRSHVKVLLDNQETMLEWNRVVLEQSVLPDAHVGAPDEMFFATMLKVQGRFDGELSETHGRIGPDSVPSTQPRHGCCTHHVSWKIVRVTDGPANHTLTRKCTKIMGDPPFHPCAYKNIFLEGARDIQNQGYLFLRKVWHAATFEAKTGEAMPLKTGLRLLHILK